MSSESKDRCQSPLSLWTCCCTHLLLWVSLLFGKAGKWIATHPWWVIVVTHVLVFFFASGFIFMKFEKNTAKLYYPQNSKAEKDLDKGNKYFPLKLRREMVILRSEKPHRKGVLTKRCFTDALRLHDAITSIENYNNLCKKDPVRNQCVSISPLEIFQYNRSYFNNISHWLTLAYRNESYTMSNGRPAYYNFPTMFGKSLKIERGMVESARALQMIYVTRDPANNSEYQEILRFEKNYLDTVFKMKEELKFVKIFYRSSRSIDDAVNENSMSDISLFFTTFLFMICFACLASGNFIKPREGHALLATSCVIAVCYGIVAGLGFGMWIGVPFVSIVGFLPFLVLGVGLDDMFIIVNEFDRQPHHLSVVRCVSTVMTNIGSSITMTTVTTLAAYLISTSTSFPAIRYFCLYATFCIAFSYLFVVGFFVAALSLDGQRMKNGRLDCLPCLPVREEIVDDAKYNALDEKGLQEKRRHQVLLADRIMRAWAEFILNTPAKVFVLLTLVGLIVCGVMAGKNMDQRFDNELIAKPGSYLEQYLETFKNLYSESLEVNIIIDETIPYKWWTTQKEILKLSSIAENNKLYRNISFSWMQAYKMWSQANKMKTSGKHFMPSLKIFLSLPPFRHFRQDIIFSKNQREILASRVLVFTKGTADTIVMCEAMVGIRNDLKTKSTLPAYAITQEFLSLETYLLTPTETLRNILLSSLTIVLITSVYLVHPAAIFLVFINFVCLTIELLGILHLWNVPLNTLAMVGFVMAVGYSIDYSAHIAHAYMLSTQNSAKERVVNALGTVGSSVFWGGFSTFLGVLMIAFSESKLFQLLFRILISIVLLGLLHGLIFLPVLLSLFCPWKLDVARTESNNNESVESDSEDEKHVVLYQSSVNYCPCDFCDRFNPKD